MSSAFSKLRAGLSGRQEPNDTPASGAGGDDLEIQTASQNATTTVTAGEKGAAQGQAGAGQPELANIEDLKETIPDDEVQNGVKDMQAITLTWSRKSLYGCLFL